MEVAILIFGLILIVIVPSLVFLSYNHIVQYFLLKPTHHGFLRTLKRTWWTSILWVLSITSSFYILFTLPDSMIIRISVTLLIIAVLLGITILNQWRMNSEDGAKRNYFNKSMIASFGVSFLIIIITFIGSIPHKIIPVTDKAKFFTNIDFISSCNPSLKLLNERGIAKGNLLYALYNEDDMELVAFIQLSPSDRKDMMNRFKFERIDTSKMDSYHLNVMDNDINNAVTPLSIQSIYPKRIGLQNIFQFSHPNNVISMNMESSNLFEESFPLKCNEFSEHYCYVQMIFDTKSNILLLVEDIRRDGP
jgi:hypothetical protein